MQRASTARGAAGSGAVLLLVFASVAVLPGAAGGGRKMALGGEARGVARYSNKVQNNLRSV